MKLTNHNKFQKDLQRFQSAIENVNDQKKKIYFNKILSQFKAQATIIDNNHSTYLSHKIDPRTIKENVKELGELRIILENLCKDLNIC